MGFETLTRHVATFFQLPHIHEPMVAPYSPGTIAEKWQGTQPHAPRIDTEKSGTARSHTRRALQR